MGCKSRFYADIMHLHENVTGSCNLIVVRFPNDQRLKFIVDCGLFNEEKEEEYNKTFNFEPEEIDFTLVTHNHSDHVGRLPLLAKKGYRNKVYATNTTCKLLPEALKDSCSIWLKKAKMNGTRSLYDENDVTQILNLCVPCEYEKPIYVHPNVKVFFFKNSHIPGAAIILVKISYPGEEDINILFTGDYNKQNDFLEESSVPKWVLSLPLTVICESTYGVTNSTEIVPCFDDNLLRAVGERKTVICLVFSLERTQKILYRLKCLQEKNLLDCNIPIYLDGNLAIRYTNMYRKIEDVKPSMRDFLPKNLTFVDWDKRNSLLIRRNSCKVILTSSGMSSYGPARCYIPAYLGKENAMIHFTGFIAKGSLGNRIKEMQKDSVANVLGVMIKKKAEVNYTSEFSAHAKADEIIDFLKQFENIKLLLVNHGEADTKEIFAEKILNKVKTHYVGVLNRKILFRINPWGLVKTISTKFI